MNKRKTIMRSLGGARRAWNQYVKQVSLEEGLPDSYRQVILFLCHNPGASQRNIAEFAGVTTSAVNQTVKNMVTEQYLRKETALSDKRNSKLYLTEKGEEIGSRLIARLDAADNAITAFLGEKTEAELIDLTDRLAELIRKEL